MASIHDFSMKNIDGAPKSLGDYRGKALLIVNVASQCGLTAQYTGLEHLHETYSAGISQGTALLCDVGSNHLRRLQYGSPRDQYAIHAHQHVIWLAFGPKARTRGRDALGMAMPNLLEQT